MARVKSIAQIRHRKILKQAKGFKQARRQRVKIAKESILHAGQYAYIGRRLRKRDMRSLWITRLSAAAKERGSSYSKLIAQLKKENIQIDRKILSDIAVKDSETFDKIVHFTP
ncbi:MAG: 50S ribosomal protein L20 [bacterium]|nr:50S ribosomal protein L20 [bacterium]